MKFFHQFHGETQIIHNNRLDFEPHLHGEIEIIVLFKGNATAMLNDKCFELCEGDFFIVAPNTIHSYTAKSKVDVGKFIFGLEAADGLEQLFKDKVPSKPKVSRREAEALALNSLSCEIIEHFGSSSPFVKSAYIALLAGKLTELCGLEEKYANEHDTVTKVFEYCQSSFKESITQKDVANALHISESYLSHIFCRKMKINFRTYINTLRTNAACRLILETDKSIIEIAEESGFSGPRSFNRAFVKNVGMTPTQYRKSFADRPKEEFWNNKFFTV